MKKTILSAAALVLILGCVAVSQTPTAPKHRVVFQVTEPEGREWNLLFIHVNNFREAFAKDGGSQIEVVFFSSGLNLLTKTKGAAYTDRLKQLSDNGVTLAACQNAMRLMNVKTEDLVPFAVQVDAGVAELARKQEAGWSYIH